MSMFKKAKFLTGLKEFFVTYSSTVKIVWKMDRRNFLRITFANALNGALVLPTLLISKLLIDSVMQAIVTKDVAGGVRVMIFAAIAGLILDRISQILQEVDRIYSRILADVLRVAKDKIIFLVSHRFSTVRKADKILVLENGQAVEYGSHSDLMKRNGRYKELFNLQAQSYQ